MLEIRSCDCADIDLHITDMLGRTVYKAKQSMLTLSQPKFYIGTGNLQRGTYIIHVLLNKEWKLTKKLVKD